MSRKSKWKKIRNISAIVLLLLIGLTFLGTRSFFITGTILPLVSSSTGLEITADQIQIRASSIEATNLQILGIQNIETLEIPALSFSPVWSQILSGTPELNQLRVEQPMIRIRLPEEPTGKKDEPSSVAQVNPSFVIRNLDIQEATFEVRIDDQTVCLSDLHLRIPFLAPGSELHLETTTDFRVTSLSGDLPEQSGKVEADIELPLSDSLHPMGLSGDLALYMDSPSPDIPPLTFSFTPDINIIEEQKRIEVRSLKAIASDENSTFGKLISREPFHIDFSTPLPSLSDSSFSLQVAKTEIQRLPFATLLPVTRGTVEANLEINIQDQANQISTTLALAVENLTGETDTLTLNDHSISLEFEAAGSKEQIDFQKIQAALSQRGQNILTFDANGNSNVTEPSATLNLEKFQSNLTLLRSLLPTFPEMKGLFSSSGKFVYGDKNLLRFRVSSSLNSGQFSSLKPFPSPVDISVVGQLEPNNLLIRTGQFSWPSPSGEQEGIRFVGSLDLETTDAPKFDLQLEADHVNVNPWIEIFPLPDPKPVQSSVSTNTVPTHFPSLPIGPSSVSLLADTLTLRDQTFEKIDLHVAVGNTSVVLHPFTFGLNDGTFQTSSSVEWPTGVPEFTSWIQITPIEVEPLLNSFLSEKTGAIKGLFSLESNLSGKGTSFPTLASTLRGSVNAVVEKGQIRLFAPVPGAPAGLLQTQKFVESVIRTLAGALAIPPQNLLEPPIEDLILNATFEDQLVTLNNFLAENSEFRFQTSGSLPLNSDALGNSSVQNLPITLGLETNSAKRIKIYREDRLEEDKIMLPPLLDIKGTLAQPEIDVRKRALAGLLLTGVNERNEIGNENLQRALGILGGFLSGEGPPPTPTPLPRPTPTP